MAKDELVRGGITLFILLNLFNFINYLFHFITARMLTVADYGVLVVLLAITHYFYLPCDAVSNTISRYTSKFFNNHAKLKDLFIRAVEKAVKFSIIAFLVFIPIAGFLSWFLNISFWLISFTGMLLLGVFVSPLMRGIIQGKKRFKSFGASLCIEAIIKIILAATFIYFFQSVYGAVLGIVVSIGLGFLVCLYFVRDILHEKRQHAEIEGIYSYGSKTFITSLAMILIFGLDVILARRFFPPEVAGQYAVASILGKAVYFGSISMGRAMFPISSLKNNKKQKTKIFKKTLFIVILICSVALIAFAFIPELIITILFGSKYVGVAGILFFMGVVHSIRSITNLNILHKLSCGEITNPWFLFIFTGLGILLLCLFHQTILTFVIALIFVDVFMLIGSLFLKTKDLEQGGKK